MLVREYRSRRKIYLPSIDLCQLDGHSCIGCCVNLDQDYNVLHDFMISNTEVFEKFFPDLSMINPVFLKEYLEEVKKVNPRNYLFLMYNCYFAGFLDEKREKAGCLIHPFRCNDIEMRDLLPVDCVPRGSCYRDILWDKLPEDCKKEFLLKVQTSSWFEYSRCVFELIPYLYSVNLLSSDLPESRYYRIAVKDRGIPVNFQLKKNLELIRDYYSFNALKDSDYYSYMKLFDKFGELYLEELLGYISEKYGLILKIIDIPEELTKDGDEYINGERIYTLFLPAQCPVDKTIIMGTNYDNPWEKLCNGDLKNSETIAFLLDFFPGLRALKNRRVNYLCVFFGGETDVIRPLTGSFYFTGLLSRCFPAGNSIITAENIIAYIHFHNISHTGSYYSVNCHIPSVREVLTDFEEYLKDYFYKDIYRPVDLKKLKDLYEKFLLFSLNIDDFPEIIDLFWDTLKSKLEASIPLTRSKVKIIIREILNDIFSLSPEERKKLQNDLENLIIKHVYNPSRDISSREIENILLKNELLTKLSSAKITRYFISTDTDYTEELFRILEKYGFYRKPDKNTDKMSFYYFAKSGVPCVCICSDREEHITGERDKFVAGLIDFFGYLERKKLCKKDYLHFID